MNNRILTRQAKAAYRSERLHFLQYPGIREFFVFCCIGADSFTLYSVFDLLMTERVDITRVITITVAAAMNIIPVLLAACLWNETLSRVLRRILSVMLITLFTVLFVLTFALRYTSRDLLFQSATGIESFIVQTSEDVGDNEAMDSLEEEEEGTTLAQDILAVILGSEPLATSIIAFYLSYEVSPYRKRKHIQELSMIELRAEIDSVRMMIHELTEDMKFDHEAYDDALFDVMAARLRDIAEQDVLKARRILAEKVGKPEGVEYLMEGGWMKDSQSGLGEKATSVQTETGTESDISGNKQMLFEESA